VFENLKRDAKRCKKWRTDTGFWIVAVYRYGMWASSLPTPFLRVPAWILYRLLHIPYFFLGIDLWAGPRGVRIGPGLRLIHPRNLIIGGAEIGEDCLIFQGVTIGAGQVPGLPKIGNGVDIYSGACVLGGIQIGDKSMVGANCVVTRNVPPNSAFLSAPGRVIPVSLTTQDRNWK
jgi:serine O-acetyltransferase